MNKDNITLLVISENKKTISFIETLAENIIHSDLSVTVCDNNLQNIQKVILAEHIDLVIFDVITLDAYSCTTSRVILKHHISILFLIDTNNTNHLIKSNFNFHLVDYLIKPYPKEILEHKIEIYLQNILHKKASEYLLSAYDESVIASKTNTKGVITYTSQAFCDISEYTKEELIGRSHNIVRHPDTSPSIYKDMWKVIQSGEQWSGEVKNLKKNGGFYWVRVTISPECNYNGDIISYSSIRQDISAEKYIQQVSLIDHLTQVYNKKYFDKTIEKEIASVQRYKYNLALLIIDIDFFKNINDTYGHLVGDAVLKEFADVLIQNTRRNDIVSRIGGEEFSIIISNDSVQSAHSFAKKLGKHIQNHTFKEINKLTVSIGISSYIQGDSFKSLFSRADQAMYQAKKSGRNCVVNI